MDMIPLLRAHGFRYVLVDSERVEAVSPMSWQELRYRPHIARHGKDEIIVVVRDRDLSNAQESGMEVDWFLNEVAERTQWCDFPPLVTTASDGENGGWFRNTTEGANFWSAFYQPLLERVRAGKAGVSPTFISDYLKVHGAHGEVLVHTGAWNTGDHDGSEFLQWTGSEVQKTGLAALAQVSLAVQAVRRRVAMERPDDGELAGLVETAMWHLLRAETSCNFFWGEAWVPRSTADLDIARDALAQVERRLGPAPAL
jgi:alpha-amylase/alpha-mannosidase (GH57 family)